MSATPAPLNVLAEALVAAHRHRAHLRAHEWPGQPMDQAQAYAIQQAVGDALGWWAPGSLPRCWKTGGLTPDTLRHAPLGEPGVRQADASGRLDWREQAWPGDGMEAEIALRLGRPVTAEDAATLTPESAWALLDGLAVAVEFAATRWLDPAQASAHQHLADGLSHGGLGLGPWQAPTRRDWAKQAVTVTRVGEPPQRFIGSHPLGHPGAVLVGWLQHLTREGATVPAGMLVTTGSWNGALNVARGQAVEIAFDGLPPLHLQL